MKAMLFQAIVVLMVGRPLPVAMVTRYAAAIERVVEEEPLPLAGRDAKARSALLLWTLVYYEAGVDLEAIEACSFEHHPGLTEDDGRSVGVTQLYQDGRNARGEPTWRGYTRGELCGDLELQLRLGLRELSGRTRRCGGDAERGLGAYNCNSCSVTTYAARITGAYRRLAATFALRP